LTTEDADISKIAGRSLAKQNIKVHTGTLVTDWDNVGRMVWEQRVCADITEAATLAVRAGNDLVMTTPGFFEGAQDAVAAGLLTEAEIDAAVRRILRLKFELGLFENPRGPDAERQSLVIGSAEHAELEAAREAKYREIREAELDMRTGKLSEADWQAKEKT